MHGLTDDGSEGFRRALALVIARLLTDDDAKDVLLEGLDPEARALALALADTSAALLEAVTDHPAEWTRSALISVIEGSNDLPPLPEP